MLEIDGNYLEGGGQILRTSIGLSALTGKECVIKNVRANRPQPGLKEQHLQAINAVSKLCDAEVKGVFKGSRQVMFKPGKQSNRKIGIEIGTAGSIGLVLQALLIPGTSKDLDISINGGATYGKWAPPIAYLEHVLAPLLGKTGYNVRVKVKRDGFYPVGKAIIEASTTKTKLKELNLTEKGDPITLKGDSIASKNLEKARVAERQAEEAKKALAGLGIEQEIKTRYVDTACPGSGIQLWLETKNTVIGGNGLGEYKKKAELVGRKAADMLLKAYEKGTVDRHAADQLIPYIGLAGKGTITTTEISDHAKTNAMVVERFLGVKFSLEGNKIECGQ